jgi:energy-coupling factor transporter ATP-binding protein EcfA2
VFQEADEQLFLPTVWRTSRSAEQLRATMEDARRIAIEALERVGMAKPLSGRRITSVPGRSDGLRWLAFSL